MNINHLGSLSGAPVSLLMTSKGHKEDGSSKEKQRKDDKTGAEEISAIDILLERAFLSERQSA